jgi:hypothetical protein
MSQRNDLRLSQRQEEMTLAEQVRGTMALAHLTRLVARLIIEIGKLAKTYRARTSRPVPEIDTD